MGARATSPAASTSTTTSSWRKGHFKDRAALADALAAKGLLDAPRVIAYCGGGISATIDAFACLLCGQENVGVYDGSMAEWVRDEELPMETGR